MRERVGLVLIGLVAGIISALLYVGLNPREPNLPAYQYGESIAAEFQAGGSGCQPAILATIGDKVKAARERNRCAEAIEEHRLKREDLTQQARAADAAQAQTWLNFYLARMALWGTIGGFLTLIAATLAAYFAREGAKAARDTVDAFTEVERADIVLTLEKFRNDSATRYDPASGTVTVLEEKFRFDVVAHNIGRSSALILSSARRWFAGKELPDQATFMADRTTYIVKEGGSVTLDLDTFQRTKALPTEGFLWILMSYRAPLRSHERIVRYCFQVHGLNSNVLYTQVKREEWDKGYHPHERPKGWRNWFGNRLAG